MLKLSKKYCKSYTANVYKLNKVSLIFLFLTLFSFIQCALVIQHWYFRTKYAKMRQEQAPVKNQQFSTHKSSEVSNKKQQVQEMNSLPREIHRDSGLLYEYDDAMSVRVADLVSAASGRKTKQHQIQSMDYVQEQYCDKPNQHLLNRISPKSDPMSGASSLMQSSGQSMHRTNIPI